MSSRADEPKILLIKGKIEIIQEFLDRTRAELEHVGPEHDVSSLRLQLKRIQERFDELTAELQDKLTALNKLEEQARQAWTALAQQRKEAPERNSDHSSRRFGHSRKPVKK